MVLDRQDISPEDLHLVSMVICHMGVLWQEMTVDAASS
jgi:hypothetical protein